MNCIEIDDIFSTAVLYEGIFGYSDVFKFSNESVNKLGEIAEKYKSNYYAFNINSQNKNYIYSREFIFKFNQTILINKIIYPLDNDDVIDYEIIDLSNENEKLITSCDEFINYNNKLEININNIKVNCIKIRFRNKENRWPKASDIEIIKAA